MKRIVAAFVLVLVALIAAVVWFAMSEPAAEPDVAAAPAPPAPTPAVRKRMREAADSAASAPATSDAKETPPPADAASLAVRVIAAGGAAVKGASVSVTDDDCEEWSAATDADGDALFEALPPGATEVRVEAKGRLPAAKTVVLAAREKARLELSLEPAAALEGVLVDAATGAPIAGAEIEVIGKSGGQRRLGEGQSDEKGRYRVDELPATGEVVLRIREPRRRVREVDVTLGTDAGARVAVVREVAGRLSGTVRNSEGAGVASARVVLRDPFADAREVPAIVADCDEDGDYVFEDVPFEDKLVAVASATGWADSAPTELLVFNPDTPARRHDFTLRRPAKLTVNVPDPDFARRGTTRLVMVRLDNEDTASALSTGSGAVVRSGLAPGTHHVRVTSDGFLPVTRRVVLPEGGSAEIEVLLVAGVEIRGRVLRGSGTSMAGAAVTAIPAEFGRDMGPLRGHLAQRAFADELGEFAFTGLEAGRYRLVADFGTEPPSAPQVVDAPASGLVFVLAPGTRISVRVVLPEGVTAQPSVAAIASAEEISPNLESDDFVELRTEPRAWGEHSTIEAEVAAGMKWLRLLAKGYAPVVIPIRTDPGKTADLGEVRLLPPTAVRGRVLDGKGGEIAGASVWATLQSASAAVQSGSDGTFEVHGLARGAAIVRAQTEGGFGAAAADAGGDAVTVVVRPFGTLSGVVVDVDGMEVRHVDVAARAGFSGSPLDRGRAYSASSGEEGRFSVRVPSGRVRVSAGGAWIETTVPPEGETEVKLQRP